MLAQQQITWILWFLQAHRHSQPGLQLSVNLYLLQGQSPAVSRQSGGTGEGGEGGNPLKKGGIF